MSRASFGGTLTIGRIALKLQAFPVAAEEKDPALRWLHRKDRGPLQNGMSICTLCGERITDEECVQGVESSKGYILLEERELKAIKPVKDEQSPMIVQQFVPETTMDSRWEQKTYYLTPKGGEGIRPYALLSRVMRMEKVSAIVTYTSYGSARLGVIKTAPTGLVLTTLYFANEIRELKDYGIDIDPIPLSKDEITLAQRVVQSRTTAFDHAAYPDEGRNLLLALIAAKSKRQKFVAPVGPASPPTPKVVSLLEALKASIDKKRSSMPHKPAAHAARARG